MNVFELFAKLTLNTKDYDEKLEDSKKKGSGIGQVLGKGLATTAKVGIAAVGAAATAVTTLTKQAVEEYSNYEQLAGGVKTLFGDSAKKVMADADNAFKTAGMSVNEYMETSIQSAASLINSLGGDQAKAADLMNMSITDMADNVNKMGTSMEGVQNAYRGFSRGNFTMLDNLALGFAGTKEGMQELLDKAHELSGVDYNIDSYADIVEAIHVVQTEMGITGTTLDEAAGTISGSVGSVKSAWQNLVTGLSNPNADLGKLINNVVDSAEVAFKNLIPTIENALGGIATLVQKIAPIIGEKLPGLANEILPPLLSATQSLANSLLMALPGILSIIVDQIPIFMNEMIPAFLSILPQVLDVALQIILALADGLTNALPELVPAIVDVILTIVEKLTEPEMLNQLINAAIEIIFALSEGLMKSLPRILEAVAYIMGNLLVAIAENVPKVAMAAIWLMAEFIASILMKAPELLEAIGMIMMNLIAAIVKFFVPMEETGDELLEKIAGAIDEGIQKAKQWGTDLIENFIGGIKSKIGAVKDAVGNVANTVKDFLGFSEPDEGPLSNFHTFAPDMIDLFTKGIDDNLGRIRSASADFASAMLPEQAGGTQLAGAGGYGGDIIIPVYIGSDKIDEVLVNAEQVRNYRSGGR